MTGTTPSPERRRSADPLAHHRRRLRRAVGLRYKDIRAWWDKPHHDRIGGVRQAEATPWVPRSKPIWFTELGCAAIDKGTNQPNKFLDPEVVGIRAAAIFHGVARRPDPDAISARHVRLLAGRREQPGLAGLRRADGRHEPCACLGVGRAALSAFSRPITSSGATATTTPAATGFRAAFRRGRLADVVAEICARSGVTSLDLDRLYGIVRGYGVGDIDGARAALQPLMIAYGFDAVERDGKVVFTPSTGRADAVIARDDACDHARDRWRARGDPVRPRPKPQAACA